MIKKRPLIYRKMKASIYYPGQYSISNADFIHFNAVVEYMRDLHEEGPSHPPLRISYRIDGDLINIAYFHSIEEGLSWLTRKLERAIQDNVGTLAAGVDRTIEDT